MAVQRYKRRRGVVLTATGIEKLDRARLERGGDERTKRITIAELSEMSSLDGATISRAISRRGGVDRQTLQLLFQSVALRLLPDDYEYLVSETVQDGDFGSPILIEIRVGRQRVLSLLASTGTDGPAIVIHQELLSSDPEHE